MGLHVVGMAVAALRVISHDDVRAQFVDDSDEFLNGVVARVNKRSTV